MSMPPSGLSPGIGKDLRDWNLTMSRRRCYLGSSMQDRTDPPIDEIREIRHRISERFGHDPERLVAYYMELQEKYRDRFVGAPRKRHDDERRD